MFCLITSSKLPANNLNFYLRWRWWDRIQATFLNLFYFTNIIYRKNFSISWISLGNYILLNVFLAIAVDNLSTEEDDEGEAPDEEKVNKQTNK